MKVTLQTHLKTGIGRINCIRPKHTNSRMYIMKKGSQSKHKITDSDGVQTMDCDIPSMDFWVRTSCPIPHAVWKACKPE